MPPLVHLLHHLLQKFQATVGDHVGRQSRDAQDTPDHGLREVASHRPLRGVQPRQATAAVKTLNDVTILSVWVLRHVYHSYLITFRLE